MLLGYASRGSETLRQAADLAGVHGLSFLLALCGVSLYLAGKRLSDRLSAKRRSGCSRDSPRSCSWSCTVGPSVDRQVPRARVP